MAQDLLNNVETRNSNFVEAVYFLAEATGLRWSVQVITEFKLQNSCIQTDAAVVVQSLGSGSIRVFFNFQK